MEVNIEFMQFIKEAFGLSGSISPKISMLSKRGSDRVFFRVEYGDDKKAILIHYDPKRTENTYYADLGRFLRNIGVSVPEIYRHDQIKHFILMEDLGSIDLWSLRNEPWSVRKALYEKAIENIKRLHSYPLADFPRHNVRIMDGFDESLYRWEHSYFLENFVIGICNIKGDSLNKHKIEGEVKSLIEKLLKSKQVLIHRDLQSQNNIIKNSISYFIDFQGMRTGNPLYDIASLLNDPYVSLSNNEKEYLLDLYEKDMFLEMDKQLFRELFWCSSCQRLMQALGAYGFLGLKKGIDQFLDYIPAGVKNLMESLANISFMPYLSHMVEICNDIVENSKTKKC